MCQILHIAVNKIKLLLFVELTFFVAEGNRAEGPGVCGMMRTIDKHNKPAGQMETAPPLIYITVKFPDAKDERSSSESFQRG